MGAPLKSEPHDQALSPSSTDRTSGTPAPAYAAGARPSSKPQPPQALDAGVECACGGCETPVLSSGGAWPSLKFQLDALDDSWTDNGAAAGAAEEARPSEESHPLDRIDACGGVSVEKSAGVEA